MSLLINQFTETPVQGNVSLVGVGGNIISGIVSNSASGALMPMVAGQAVKIANESTGVPSFLPLAANTDVTAGFIVYNVKDINYAANSRIEVVINGSIVYMTSGGAINRWGQVEVVYNASGGGNVIASAAVNPVVGFAFDKATASGQLIRVYIEDTASVATTIGSVSGLQSALNALQASVLPTEVATTISTVGAGTLTAAGLVGKLIIRTGSTSAFTDTTDTAPNIYAALNTYVSGGSFEVKIQNQTAFAETLAAGTGVTLTGNVIVPPLATNTYLLTMNSTTTATLLFVSTAVATTKLPISITNLTTVGAGTITAAGITSGITNRTGSTAAFTDTTDTAANIIAGLPNAKTGESFEYLYYNNTGFAATLAAGTTVTLAGTDGGIPAGTWLRMLVTLTSASAVTMTGIESGYIGTLPPAQFATGTTTSTFTAGQLTGANYTVYTNTGATPGSIATRTATQMIGDIPNAYIGQTWVTRIVNGQGTGTLTVTAGTGVTLTGTATVAVNTWRDFACSITSIVSDTITMQNIGTGTFS